MKYDTFPVLKTCFTLWRWKPAETILWQWTWTVKFRPDEEDHEVKDMITALMWFSHSEIIVVSFGSYRTRLHTSIVWDSVTLKRRRPRSFPLRLPQGLSGLNQWNQWRDRRLSCGSSWAIVFMDPAGVPDISHMQQIWVHPVSFTFNRQNRQS